VVVVLDAPGVLVDVVLVAPTPVDDDVVVLPTEVVVVVEDVVDVELVDVVVEVVGGGRVVVDG
jgi:hypothetical protein